MEKKLRHTAAQIDDAIDKTKENEEGLSALALRVTKLIEEGVDPADIKVAIDAYLENNPIESGMTESGTWPTDNTPVDNTKYSIGEISELTIAALPADNSKGVLIYFTAAAEGCTLTYPSATQWYGEDAPSAEGGKSYVILIADGVCGINVYNEQSV